MKIVIHRGTHEIGGSCVEITSGNNRIVLDIGLPLEKLPDGKNSLRPNVAGLYPDSPGTSPDAVFVSHPHLDHYGFLPEIRPEMPIYIGEAAAKLLKLTSIFARGNYEVKNPIYLKNCKPVKVGVFTVTPYLMDHSAYDSYAFVVTDGSKTLIYSGDFRDHGRKAKLFQAFLRQVPKNPDILLMEGTTLPAPDSTLSSHSLYTENDVEEKLTALSRESNKPILILSSGQNIDRLVSFYKAARHSGRILAIDVYVANVLNELYPGTKLPHPSRIFKDLRVYFPNYLTTRLCDSERGHLVYPFKHYKITSEQMSHDKGKMMILTRPSLLPELKKMDFLDKAELVYSQWKGYLKEESMENFLEFSEKKNMKLHIIHSGGHAFQQTLQKMVSSIKPKLLIPIHTQNPEFFDRFGCITKLLKDGEVLEM